jgi:mannonate dehydratase
VYLGTQHLTGDDWAGYRALAQLGVNHVSANPPGDWRSWSTGVLAEFKERLASFGIELEMVMLPLGSRTARENDAPHVFLGSTPERDREIDQICGLIRNLAEARIPAARYNITILGHLRTPDRRGRGGAILSSFEYDKLDQPLEPHPDGPVEADEMWERVDDFLARVVPVAEAYKVRLACHPNDPGIGGRTYRGIASVLDTVEGLKQLVSLRESPYHGLNFCQGTISEMLENPGEQIYDVIRYFGERKKIFNVHFRNIQGGLLNFVEVFPDEGDVNMLKALRTYQEVGYPYMIMPDHVPEIAGPAPEAVGFAYCFGYIRALLQVVEAA